MPNRLIERLEVRRHELGLSRTKFAIKHLHVEASTYLYLTETVSTRGVPDRWIPKAAAILELTVEDCRKLAIGGQAEEVVSPTYSADELRAFANIVERAGRPLPLETIILIAAHTKTAGS